MSNKIDKEDIDLIRDIALSLEQDSFNEALALIRLARKLRPGGKLIQKKLEEMERQKESSAFYKWDDSQLNYGNSYQLKETSENDTKYVISADVNNIYSGLGCLLLVLAPAWKYAKSTGRVLVIDWRGSPYLRAFPQINLFSRLFDTKSVEATGVTVIADDTVSTHRFPDSVLVSKINCKHESGKPISSGSRGEMDSEVISTVLGNIDSAARTFLPALKPMYEIATSHAPDIDGTSRSYCSYEEATLLYSSLNPLPPIQKEIDDFYTANMSTMPVIGVHIRHGNGEEKSRKHFSHRVIKELDDFLDVTLRRVENIARDQHFDSYRIFLCTDSRTAVDAMREKHPNVLSRDMWRPQINQGMDFDQRFNSSDDSLRSAVNALIDMQLLSKCDVAILTKATAFGCHIPFIQRSNAAFFDHSDFERLE